MGWLTWGAQVGSNLERAGIELSTVPEGVNSGTTQMDLYLNFWADAAYTTSDDQVMSWGGSGISGSTGFRMTQGARVVGSAQILGQGLSPGGGPTYNWSVSITGHYQGANPTHSVGWTLPARPAPSQTYPGAPPVFVDTITATSARLGIGNPGSDGGAAIDQYHLRLQRNSDAAIIWEQAGIGTGYYTIGSLVRATGYVVYGRAHNAIGWGPWSGGLGFNTKATAPDKMAAPVMSSITATTAYAGIVTPNAGGSAITAYEVQVALDFGFTSGVSTFPNQYLSGLTRNTNYFVRARAINAIGAGVWSDVVSFATLKTAPSTMAAPVVAAVGSRTATVTYQPPADNGGDPVTSYGVQVATDAAFTQNVQIFPSGSLSGLKRGRLHYVRVRAGNATGVGAWSPSTTLLALTGARVKVDDQWRPARIWVKVGGTWRPAYLYQKIDGTWVG